MSSQSKNHLGRALAILPAIMVVLCTFAPLAAAQDQPFPKWELYGGYSFLYPNTDVTGQLPGALLPLTSRLESNPRGAGVSGTYNFTKWFGVTVDASDHWGSGETTLAKKIDDTRFANLSIGPKLTLRRTHFSPFVEALVGDHRLFPEIFKRENKFGAMFGGGLDINLSPHVAWRLFRADYVMSNYQFGPAATTASTDLRAVRLQMGLNFMFGGGPPPLPPSAACTAEPSEVYAGEPVTATATGSNFNPKHTIKYTWTGTGVKVTGSDASTQVDTTGLQPGSYQVAANLNDGHRNGLADCNAKFSVKEPRPPVISCSPDPATVQPGGNSTITSVASSPDSRKLAYSYSSTAGSISGTDASATLNTGSAQPGPITVTCNVADDRNPALTAAATTTVTVEAPPAPAPPPPAAPEASKLNEIDFKKNSPRVDNAAKAILDEVALRLQRDADSKAVLVGEAGPSEHNHQRLAAQRAFNTKAYLVNEKGIDAARLETRTGSDASQKTQIWLVPPGATFNDDGTQLATQQATRARKHKK